MMVLYRVISTRPKTWSFCDDDDGVFFYHLHRHAQRLFCDGDDDDVMVFLPFFSRKRNSRFLSKSPSVFEYKKQTRQIFGRK